MADELDQSEDALPPPTEEVHLPDPSYLPAVMAAGITFMIVGLTLGIPVIVFGAILFFVTLFRWIRQTREEMAELPLEH